MKRGEEDSQCYCTLQPATVNRPEAQWAGRLHFCPLSSVLPGVLTWPAPLPSSQGGLSMLGPHETTAFLHAGSYPVTPTSTYMHVYMYITQRAAQGHQSHV